MKNFLLPLLLIIGYAIASAQTDPAKIIVNVDDKVNPWNHLQVNNAPQSFQFAIVTDRTGGLRPGVFASAVPKINLLQPEFVMSVGDLIPGYTEDEAQIDREWDEFDGLIKDLDMPFFYLPGNHDYINDVMAKKWEERYGKDYYHFTYKDVLFLCLNTEELKRGSRKGAIGDPQYEYIKKTLAENTEAKWTLIFMHQPLWDQEEDPGRWPDVEKLLTDRKHTVFVGHRHRYVKYERNNGKYFILATTGGGSGLRGPNFGEFDHVVWVTMTDDGPILANLMLEGIWDENVNTEEYSAFSDPLRHQKPWDVMPVYADKQGFSGGELAFRITNDSDVPMQIEIAMESSENLWVQSSAIQQTLDPNTVETWKIPILTPNNNTQLQTDPLQLNFTATYQPDNQPELVLRGTERIEPIISKIIPQATQTMVIDGNSDEWKSLRYHTSPQRFHKATPITHRGNGDCQVQFDLQYDKDFLYLMANVTDDQLESKLGSGNFEQDGLFVVLDARPTVESVKGRGGRVFREIMLLGASPGKDEPIYHFSDQYPKGTQIAAMKTDAGYQVEMAIPTAYLDEKYGKSWENLRLNVFASDSDNSGTHKSQIFWQPDWREDDNVMGSGMFRR